MTETSTNQDFSECTTPLGCGGPFSFSFSFGFAELMLAFAVYPV